LPFLSYVKWTGQDLHSSSDEMRREEMHDVNMTLFLIVDDLCSHCLGHMRALKSRWFSEWVAWGNAHIHAHSESFSRWTWASCRTVYHCQSCCRCGILLSLAYTLTAFTRDVAWWSLGPKVRTIPRPDGMTCEIFTDLMRKMWFTMFQLWWKVCEMFWTQAEKIPGPSLVRPTFYLNIKDKGHKQPLACR